MRSHRVGDLTEAWVGPSHLHFRRPFPSLPPLLSSVLLSVTLASFSFHSSKKNKEKNRKAVVMKSRPPPTLQPASPPLLASRPSSWLSLSMPISSDSARRNSVSYKQQQKTKDFAVPRRNALSLMLSSYILSEVGFKNAAAAALAQPSVGFREYIDSFDGYSFKYPQNWIQVRGAGADIFFRDPYVLDENLSVEMSSPSSSMYKTVEDLGPPQEAGKKVLKQYLTEFMSTRLGVRRESNILSTSSRVADDGRLYYQVEVNIKSYANSNELAVMPQDRVVRLEWDRRYLSVLGVENNRLYELRLQTPENVFVEEESELRQVMDSFRVNKVTG